MLLKIVLFAVIAVGSAGFGVIGWIGLHNPVASTAAEAALPPPPTTRAVLVAASALVAGSLMKPDSVTSAEVDVATLKPGFWADTPAARGELVGSMIRRSMAANEVMMPIDLMRPGEHGFLAAVLGSNERAVSIGVDAVSGTAGLIWPGDHVDVILTQQIDDQTASAGHHFAGETVLHGTRVIAIDQELVHGGGNSAENSSNRTVTLEVTASEAERVSVAMRLGKLSLVVVSADQEATDLSQPQAKTVTWGGDVSAALRQNPTAPGNTIHVFQAGGDAKEFHF